MSDENSVIKTTHAGQQWHRLVRWLIMLRGTPRAVASGVAIGVFVAFMPCIGFQTAIALVLATFLNANRPAAMALVWITNPLTVPPCFAFTYWVGSRFWTGPSLATVSREIRNAVGVAGRHDFWEMYDQFSAFIGIGGDVIVPLLIGGVVVGAPLGSAAYFLTLEVLRRYRRHRVARRGRRALAGDSTESRREPMTCIPHLPTAYDSRPQEGKVR